MIMQSIIEKKYLDNMIILITGGTGEIGYIMTEYLLNTSVREIRILSRSEKKQYEMWEKFRQCLTDSSPRLVFYPGDVRNPDSLKEAFWGCDCVIHAAALKQVPVCELFPMEAYDINIRGTYNVLNESINASVPRCVCISSDKCSFPINTMGLSKAMMEKVAGSMARRSDKISSTRVVVARFSNALCSEGAVISTFEKEIKEKRPITITDPEMTRFFITKEEIVQTILFSMFYGKNGDIVVPKEDSACIGSIAEASKRIWGEAKIEVIGTRKGENRFETLVTEREACQAEQIASFFLIPSSNMNIGYEEYVSKGESSKKQAFAYTSDNTSQLCIERIEEIIRSEKGISI